MLRGWEQNATQTAGVENGIDVSLYLALFLGKLIQRLHEISKNL